MLINEHFIHAQFLILTPVSIQVGGKDNTLLAFDKLFLWYSPSSFTLLPNKIIVLSRFSLVATCPPHDLELLPYDFGNQCRPVHDQCSTHKESALGSDFRPSQRSRASKNKYFSLILLNKLTDSFLT